MADSRAQAGKVKETRVYFCARKEVLKNMMKACLKDIE